MVALTAIASVSHAAWDHPHADSANTGFARLITASAARPMQCAEVGELAPGAGPVAGPDGTVYIGNLYGQVLAFHADGTPAWGRQLPEDTGWPLPGVAIWQNPRGGDTPTVIVSNGLQDTVEYTFDPAHGFTAIFRVQDAKRSFASAPVALPDGHTVLGTSDGRLTFAGPNVAPVADTTGNLETITAAPTRLADGRLVAIERFGRMTAFAGGNTLSAQRQLVGESIASAAASCTYVYVASVGAFTTFDAATLAPVATVPWFRGGRSSPAIGPDGHVYAVAATTLYVFAPPPQPATTFAGTTCDPSVSTLGTFLAQ